MEQDPEAAGRRTFLRQLGGQAVEGAGRLAGLSNAMRRSVVAAASATARELAAEPLVETVAEPALPPPAARTVPPPASNPPAPPPTRSPAPSPSPSLTPAHEAFLRSARSGTLAVNDPGGPPHLSSVVVNWEDDRCRIPTAMFSARANAIDRDPRVSLLVDDPEPGGGRWIAIAGVASLDPDPTDADRAVITIRPTRITSQIG